MPKSKIEWTDETINLTTGCSKISDGCKNCYAEKMHRRLQGMGLEKYKEPFDEVVMHWGEINDMLYKLDCMRKPRKIFINSMSDLFHKEVSDRYIKLVLTTIAKYPKHTFQLLTKRAYRLKDFSYPKNVWLGVTVEAYDLCYRLEYLKETNAKVKFVSFEPLLTHIPDYVLNDLKGTVDWVIVGGETGLNARPVQEWCIRVIKKKCISENIPFFFKQRNKKGDNLIDGQLWQQFPKKEAIGRGSGLLEVWKND